ncbi:hypothetical protein [Clostridium hydrogeniformans]|uniref:hypothetical protein n=1 Tax=Clostridium hydrogeniformans TaxID=349933 RepID=UPI000AFBE9FB|nr:hypothetical protein [Clostridium hydrogeniformans]
MYNDFLNNSDEKKEKLSFKDFIAIVIAQYSILLPIVLIAFLIWGGLIWFVVNVLMGG